MLTLRTNIGLTQAGLAEQLSISRRSVAEWEAGSAYPTIEHLKQFVVLATQRQAWPSGREEAEIRAFWQAAHQKVLLDEAWLSTLLSDAEVPRASEPGEETSDAAQAPTSTAGDGPRLDWGDAPAETLLYGREWELDLLAEWVVEEHCRVVSVLGQGALASRRWRRR